MPSLSELPLDHALAPYCATSDLAALAGSSRALELADTLTRRRDAHRERARGVRAISRLHFAHDSQARAWTSTTADFVDTPRAFPSLAMSTTAYFVASRGSRQLRIARSLLTCQHIDRDVGRRRSVWSLAEVSLDRALAVARCFPALALARPVGGGSGYDDDGDALRGPLSVVRREAEGPNRESLSAEAFVRELFDRGSAAYFVDKAEAPTPSDRTPFPRFVLAVDARHAGIVWEHA